MNKSFDIKIVIWLSLFISLLLHSYTYTLPFDIIKPNWVLIFILYWSLTEPKKFGLYSIFIVGLIYDLFTGTLLGMHAVCLTLTASPILLKSQLIKNLALWQQAFIIIALSFLYISLLFIVNIAIYKMIAMPTALFLSSFIDGIMWLFLFFIFGFIKRKF